MLKSTPKTFFLFIFFISFSFETGTYNSCSEKLYTNLVQPTEAYKKPSELVLITKGSIVTEDFVSRDPKRTIKLS